MNYLKANTVYVMLTKIAYLRYLLNKFKKRRMLWHKTCFQIVCQPVDYVQKFVNIIPRTINPAYQKSHNDFSRKRSLPFPKLITFILHLAASGTNRGIDIKSGHFFKNARRSGLWPDAKAVHHTSVSKARKKVPWQVFQDIQSQAIQLAYDLWPKNDITYLWHGMSVFAADGSKYNLPATVEIRDKFDSESGLHNNGKGHYPQCLVSTLYDVFRRLPVARTVVGINGSERDEMKKLLPYVPPNSVWMFDRGYPSYETIHHLNAAYRGYYLFRCPASSTFPAVETFIKTGAREDIIWLMPSHKFKNKVSLSDRAKLKPVKLRAIRLKSPDGTLSVLLTNLFNKKKYSRDEIINLYFRRWEVETYYRDEKVTMEIEKFHSKTENGILQELYAAMIMSVISRTLMMLCAQTSFSDKHRLQFKNAVLHLSSEVALLVPDDVNKAISVFKDILSEISRVKYYVSKDNRTSQPRVNKSPLNKWKQKNRLKAASLTFA